jgi:hypothetical protein
VVGNAQGEVLLAWTEGTGWNKGGTLAYARFDIEGKLLGKVERVPDGVPAWGLPTVAVTPEGKFLVMH